MAFSPEQFEVRCAEALARWEKLSGDAAIRLPDRREEFEEVAGEMGVFGRVDRMRIACANPAYAETHLGQPSEEALEDLNTDLLLLEMGVEKAGTLNVSLRSAVRAAAQTLADEFAEKEAESRRARVREYVVPAVLGILGAIVTTAVTTVIFGD